MQAYVFSINKTRQHILSWPDIHSFVSIRSQLNTLMPLSVFTIKSVSCTLVIICFWIPKWAERLLARLAVCMYTYLVCVPFVQLISREISQATGSLTFSTRDLILDTRNYRGSRLEDQGSRDCRLTFERYCTLLDSLEALNNKSDRIKLTHCISNSSISFRIYFSLGTRHLVLQFPTFQKPLKVIPE